MIPGNKQVDTRAVTFVFMKDREGTGACWIKHYCNIEAVTDQPKLRAVVVSQEK